ncbi:uncharacterized protein LOC129589890 isoform X2 [Paramacrobiotus metropolitanus]|uniref:uncharacterized protein LOC129589890 isoform X2 n=1 Tax=Paramacrobiotus metropolitanus TaxID=2943436 RepID=UPI002445CE97|nr:uncharacterized protein LOC129589890 isoform X2 [Paramacrobiotus metropolitanus]
MKGWSGFPDKLLGNYIIYYGFLSDVGRTSGTGRHTAIDIFCSLMQGIQFTFMRLADWMLVAFTFERLFLLIDSFRFGLLQRASTARRIIVILFIFSALTSLFCFVEPWFVNYADTFPEWILRWERVEYVAEIVLALLTFFLILIPTIGVILFLMHYRQSMIRDMRAQQRITKSSVQNKNTAPRKCQSGKICASNWILLDSAASFVVSRFPIVIFMCMNLTRHTASDTDNSSWAVALPLVWMVMYTDYVFTFFVYMNMDQQFRQEFFSLFIQPLITWWNRYAPAGRKLWLMKMPNSNSSSATLSGEMLPPTASSSV